MKKILLLFFLLLSISNDALAQIYEIKYQLTKPFSRKKYEALFANKSPAYALKLEKMFRKESDRIREFTLLFNNGKSKFSIEPYTILNNEKDYDARRVQGYGDTYKDFSKGHYVQVADFIGKNTAVRERFDEIFDWHIESKRDTTIYGFSCQRATTLEDGKMIVAWFTKSIPIMDGPFRYAGLPGLIMQLETPFGITKAVEVNVVKNQDIEIIIPTKKEYISFKEMKESRTLTVKAKRIKKKE